MESSSHHAGRTDRGLGSAAARAHGHGAAASDVAACRLARQRDALVRLTVETAAAGSNHQAALALITEIAACTLGVERTSVWRYDESRDAIRCIDLFERRGTRHSSGAVLQRGEVPAYFAALEQSDVIVAHDAHTDARTREFSVSYLAPLGIASMLDATVRFGGRIDGVLCHEHIGEARRWAPDEESFAVSVANLVALVLERWERATVEARLRESERQLAQAQRIGRLGSWEMTIVDPENFEVNPVRWSAELSRMIGRAEGLPPTASAYLSCLHPDDVARTFTALRQTIATGEIYDLRHRIIRPSGEVRVLQQRAQLIAAGEDGYPRLVGATQDVTEMELTLRALERSREEFRLLFTTNPMSMWVYELDTMRFLAVNRAAVSRYGYSESEFLGMTIADIRPPEELPRLLESQKRRPQHLDEAGIWRHRTKTGRELSVRISTHPIQFEGRTAELVLAEDVTAAELALNALRESEERFRQMADNIEAVVWMADIASGAILYVNPAYERIWGRACEHLMENPRAWFEAVAPADRARVAAGLSGQTAGEYNVEYRIVRPDGTVRWIADRAYPIRNREGVAYRIVGVARDITETKQLEERFLRAQRMEAVGTLASGVAHDLNNILAPILMVGGLLREKLTDAGDLAMVRMVEQSAQRGAGIVAQLLTFSRGLGGERLPLQAETLVKEIRHLLTETFPRNIEIVAEFSADLPSICADATQVHQVLMNLCVNARDAMPGGGRLTLNVRQKQVSELEAARHVDAKAGPHVVISVADSGTGIPPDVLHRVFDPFFTTKEVGKGTGLGLSTVLGIVRSHGGFVTVQSELGRGTRFEVHFPAESGGRVAVVSNPPAPPVSHRHETVLVVDDEEAVRNAARVVLERGGYRVLEAVDGKQALEVFAAHAVEVKAVLSDVMMPVVDGWTLARELRERAPDLPVILCSGLDAQAPGPERERVPVASVLPKPFSAVALLDAVNRALH